MTKQVSHTTYLLVHGAWGAAGKFADLIKLLTAAGDEVVAIDLPGHGGNRKPINEVTLACYVDAVCEAMNRLDNTVTLVGHSFGGVVISQVAEIMPQKVKRLIYLAGLLPASGQSAAELLQSEGASDLPPFLDVSSDRRSVALTDEAVKTVMLNDIQDADRVSALLPDFKGKQATAPLNTAAKLTEHRFGQVPKHYICTDLDRVVTPDLQENMLRNCQIESTHRMRAGHFPFLSQPESLADIFRTVTSA